MVGSRHVHVKFLQGSYLASDAAYGSVTYGEDAFTYGQQGTQSVLSGVSYELLPSPGWHPQDPAWVFRAGDTTRFSSLIVSADDPTKQVDVSTIVSATLVLTEWGMDGATTWKRGFDLLADVPSNSLYRDWLPDDLVVQGRFRVVVRILFESGRNMTVESNDSVVFQINDSQQEDSGGIPGDDFILLLTPQGEGILTPASQAIALPEGQTV